MLVIAIVVILIIAAVAAAVILMMGEEEPEPEPTNLLEKGFKVELVYNSGNTARQIASELLKSGLEGLNPGKIQVKVTELEWSKYQEVSRAKGVALFIIGWAPDYPDPDNYINPFYHTGGTLASRVAFSNATIDMMIENAAADLNPVTRAQTYEEIMNMCNDQYPYLWMAQSLNWRPMRDWVQGFYYNQMYSELYVYPISKAEGAQNPDSFILQTIEGNPDYFDPAKDYETAGGEVLQHVYETLTFYDDNSVNVKPWLCTELPTVLNDLVSPDGLEYTYNLRTGVKFHDGSNMTSADVKYSFDRLLALNYADGPAWMYGQITIPDYYDYSEGEFNATTGALEGGIPQSVLDGAFWAVDADTFQINLTQPYPAWNDVVAFNGASIVSKNAVEVGLGTTDYAALFSSDAYDFWDQPENMCGTGPYKMKAFFSLDRIEMERFDDYRRGPAPLKNFVIQQIPTDDARINNLKAGTCDYSVIPTLFKADIEGQPGIYVSKNNLTFSIQYMGFNQKFNTSALPTPGATDVPEDFFSDVRIRQAMTLVWDAQAYIDNVLKGQGIVPNCAIPKGMFGWTDDIPKQEFNLTKAADLLASIPIETESHVETSDFVAKTLSWNPFMAKLELL
jgi:ABC-type transport system substrate-binding protein